MFDCQQFLVTFGHIQLISVELEKSVKTFFAMHASHYGYNTPLPCLNLT